jgi:outer membrane biosynthesis protein TonB
MFCQSCGQKNIDEARFCNFCGERIAAPGTPGGRLDIEPGGRASTSEQWGPSMTLGDSLAMSLAGLGIKTRGRAYGLVVTLALSLMAIGGVLALVLSGSGDAPAAEKGHASPGDTFLVGAPIPEGLDLPPYPGEAGGVPPESAPFAPTSTPREPRSVASRPAQPSDLPSAPPPAANPSTEPASPARPPEPPPAAPVPKQEAPPAPPPATPAAETTPPAVKDPAAETELELYAGRVRFAISRYYASPTQSCFEKATQLNSTLSGTVVIATKVGADGQVKDASPSRNSTGDQSLGECLATQVRSFRLPPPPNGEIELKLPFSR